MAVSAGDTIAFCAAGPTGEGGVAIAVGPAVSAAGVGLGVEKALLRRAIDGAAARGARSLRAEASLADASRAQLLVGLGFARQPQAGASGQVVFAKALV